MNSTLKTIVTRALLLSIALTVAAASSPLRAQVIGDRVRLLTADESATGEIVRLSDDGFELASDQVRRFFAYQDLESLEVSGKLTSRWLLGSALGFLAGALVGDLAAGEAESGARKDWIAPVSGVVGGVLGGTLGFRLKDETWQPVLLPDDTVTVGFADEPIFVGRDRLRVSVDRNRLIGQLTAVTGEELEITQGGIRRSLAYRDIDSLERSVGMRFPWKMGVGLGLLGGAVAFRTYYGAWGCADDPICEDNPISAWIVIGGGLGLGAVALMMRRESWESIPLRDNAVGLSPIVTPHRGPGGRYGLWLGARIEF